jgi:hypothetical protein
MDFCNHPASDGCQVLSVVGRDQGTFGIEVQRGTVLDHLFHRQAAANVRCVKRPNPGDGFDADPQPSSGGSQMGSEQAAVSLR